MTTQDLTQITTPFGLLPPETQQALREWPHGIEWFDGATWCSIMIIPKNYYDHVCVRAKPAPAIPDTINWEHVAPEWKFMARDKDGEVCFYQDKPFRDSSYWSCGVSSNAHDSSPTAFASYTKGTADWRDSLVARP